MCKRYSSLILRCFLSFYLVLVATSVSWADDPFGKPTTPSRPHGPSDMALDQVNWNRIQGIFSWITMSRGVDDTPWDSTSGRPGWMTIEDAYVQPVEPGVSEFSVDTDTFYIVFEGQPLDAPAQFAAAWFKMKDGEIVSNTPVDKDVIELDMNQRFGYFEIYQPEEGWKAGNYLVKIYYGSPGQDLHAINVVGTMQFTIKN